MSTARPLLPTPARPAGVAAKPAVRPSVRPDDRSGFGGLSAAEWRRRLYHTAPALPAALLWVVPHRVPLSPTLRGILLAACAVLAGLVWREWRHIRRADDPLMRARFPAVFGYAGGVMLTLLGFPDRPECGFAVLAILAFGDGAATVFGKLSAGTPLHAPLPWNRAKSWAGLLAFWLVGGPAAAMYYRGETLNPEAAADPAAWPAALAVTAPAVLVAGLWESARSRWNDNVRVALAAAVCVLTAHAVRAGGF